MFTETAISQRSKHKQELRKVILGAARNIFVQEGYESFSMRKLANKIRYSPGGIYLHFKNKQQLFDSLVEESFAHLHAAMRKLMSAGQNGDPVEMLRKGLLGYVEFGLRHANDYRFAFLLSPPVEKRPPGVHSSFEALREMVRLCLKEKRFRVIDVETASQALWASAHGITSLLIQRPSFPWAGKEQLIATVIDNSIAGLLPSAGRTSRRRK
jgi:AcrR family transcriptional regulator